MLPNLWQFQRPEEGSVTLCEVEGQVHSMPYDYANVSIYTNAIQKHPVVNITRDLLHPHKLVEDGRDLLLPVETTFMKLVTQTYWEHGFRDAVQVATKHPKLLIAKSAHILLTIMDKITGFKQLLNPAAAKTTRTLIAEYVQTRDWPTTPIRAIAWHHSITKIAVAASDDVVRIYCENGIISILKCRLQKNITCVAWRPLSNAEIAVGCEHGVIVWNADANSMVTRPSLNHAVILHRIEHAPVVSIAWSPRGDVLATAAANNAPILLWDVELDRTSTLKRPGTLAHGLLCWSPVGDRLFAATSMYVFRVWDAIAWRADRWNVHTGRVQAACWSPNGRHLLFATNDEPIIYVLSFSNSDLMLQSTTAAPAEAASLYDVGEVDLEGCIVGGCVRSLAWETRGHNLAVLFEDSDVVAVFDVVLEPYLQLLPAFLISGNVDETPMTMQFQPQFEHGACLSIAWSSGRLQHFPMVYFDKLAGSPRRLSNGVFSLSSASHYYSPT